MRWATRSFISPFVAADDLAHMLRRNGELFGERLLGDHASYIGFPDLFHLLGGEFGLMVPFATMRQAGALHAGRIHPDLTAYNATDR